MKLGETLANSEISHSSNVRMSCFKERVRQIGGEFHATPDVGVAVVGGVGVTAFAAAASTQTSKITFHVVLSSCSSSDIVATSQTRKNIHF